jgi:hypothetical protein
MNDFREEASRFRSMDDAALTAALLDARTCPHCRKDLLPVALLEDVWACRGPNHSPETWYLPKEAKG